MKNEVIAMATSDPDETPETLEFCTMRLGSCSICGGDVVQPNEQVYGHRVARCIHCGARKSDVIPMEPVPSYQPIEISPYPFPTVPAIPHVPIPLVPSVPVPAEPIWYYNPTMTFTVTC